MWKKEAPASQEAVDVLIIIIFRGDCAAGPVIAALVVVVTSQNDHDAQGSTCRVQT